MQGFAACGDGAVLVQGHLNGFPDAGKAVRRLSFFQIIGSIAQIGELHSAGAVQQPARPGFLAAVDVLGHLGALRVGIQGKLSAAVNRLLLAVEHKCIITHRQAIPLDGQGLFHNQFYRRGFVLHVADLNLGAGILHHRVLRQRLIAYLGLVIQNRPDEGNVGGNLISGRVKLDRHLIGGGQQRAIRHPDLSLGHHGLVEGVHILEGQALQRAVRVGFLGIAVVFRQRLELVGTVQVAHAHQLGTAVFPVRRRKGVRYGKFLAVQPAVAVHIFHRIRHGDLVGDIVVPVLLGYYRDLLSGWRWISDGFLDVPLLVRHAGNADRINSLIQLFGIPAAVCQRTGKQNTVKASHRLVRGHHILKIAFQINNAGPSLVDAVLAGNGHPLDDLAAGQSDLCHLRLFEIRGHHRASQIHLDVFRQLNRDGRAAVGYAVGRGAEFIIQRQEEAVAAVHRLDGFSGVAGILYDFGAEFHIRAQSGACRAGYHDSRQHGGRKQNRETPVPNRPARAVFLFP